MCKYAKTVLATDGRPNALSSYEHKCAIVNTADYCSTTVKQMEQVIKSKVETPEEYAEQINFEGSYSELLRAASSAVGALVSQSMAAVETGFERKIKIAWSTLRSVGDQSGYVLTIREKFAEANSQRVWD
ncbi:Vacuolar protein sorting-associated protein 53-like protein [Zancudomyces culisetae]|uniref:Vacuolar protein sorting-associated protein 53-like protein n=1 Tax=Zancudomyces culisetae TaxID=1213189 RepID=A0A1R1PGX0_ZANCU|nr:Vacuolar protein sorting-associated protein 53-like protein [Zancudomyces culisetae]|eukprot:OMH80224.1 Vacuolar protein sorting-associated protein 53-like protein [Zancudomyces culisetae]